MNPPQINIPDISFANMLVFLALSIAIASSVRKSPEKKWILSFDDTQELKWWAILSVIFIHIGYSLVGDWRFLHPISSLAWVGVDMFLFLSGYWLTMSMIRSPLSPREFYRKRIVKILVPFWISLILILSLDFCVRGVTYPLWDTVRAFFWWFPHADIWHDMNSPYWYMTILLFFYILFPIVFLQKHIWLSTLTLAGFALILTHTDPLHLQTTWLHRLHTLAFPFWVFMAGTMWADRRIEEHWKILRSQPIWRQKKILILFFLMCTGLLAWNIDTKYISEVYHLNEVISYSAAILEQIRSLIIVCVFLIFASLSLWKSRFLILLGALSYEIYLIHWPLIARYDIFFSLFPTWLATSVWIGVLILLGWGMQRALSRMLS